MTPKEKANDLIRRFYSIGAIECKQCALIAVGELLSETEERDGMRVINNPYWLEVKKEIEKL
jgi:hypothetical protein